MAVARQTKHNTKGGAPNAELRLKKLLMHMKNVYKIPEKIKRLTDVRQRKTIPHYNVAITVLMSLILQYESFHTVFSAPESMKKRLKHMVKGRIPKVDAVRAVLAGIKTEELTDIQASVIDRVKRNRVLRAGTIGGYITAAIDGVELFSSTRKSCPSCLTRKNQGGRTEYFHRSVVCASVGSSPHIVFGQEMLHPRDGGQKDEGEQTGGKRLIKRLYHRHGRFADVIAADALYLNTPFINTVLECKMDVVIRLKDERRTIFQDAEALFRQDIGKSDGFRKGNTNIEVWDLSDFEMAGCTRKLRVVKFRETARSQKGTQGQAVRTMWLATTLETASSQILWEMMHKRWDIEENVFHQLKTYYHAKHCYCHAAVEAVFQLMLLAFNMRELYLFRRLKDFKSRAITRKSVTRLFRDQVLLEDFKSLLYYDDG